MATLLGRVAVKTNGGVIEPLLQHESSARATSTVGQRLARHLEYGQRVANERAEILRIGDTVAAFVAEPVVGATMGAVPAVGLHPYPRNL